ncbi:MAG: ABC transporter permease [Candidatus Limnocylindrales bacterium]
MSARTEAGRPTPAGSPSLETGEAARDSAPISRPTRGWAVVARKEVADHLHSVRFFILVIVLGAAAVVPLYFAADAIRAAASQVSGASAIFLALFVLPPPSLSVPPVYGFVGIVAPLLGVAFAFDAINGERSEGTLPRLVAQPIHRDDVITGKFLGGLAVIMLVLVSVVLVIAGFGILRLGITPAPSEVLRVAVWLLFTIVWVSLWLAFGLLLSVVIRRASTAALAGFGIWLLLQIFGELLVGLVTQVVAPYASASTDTQAVALKNLSDTITRIVPLTLYQEGSRVILDPSQTTVSTPATIGQLQQYQQQIPTLLSLQQSLLLVWPHVVILVALTAVCFAIAYIRFMRQEIRA